MGIITEPLLCLVHNNINALNCWKGIAFVIHADWYMCFKLQVNLLLHRWMKDLEKIFYGNIVAYDSAILPEAKQNELSNVIWRLDSLALGSAIAYLSISYNSVESVDCKLILLLNCAVAIESQWAAEETPFLMLDAKFSLLNTCHLCWLCAGISFLMMVHRHQMMLHHRQSRHVLFYCYYCESVIVTRKIGIYIFLPGCCVGTVSHISEIKFCFVFFFFLLLEMLHKYMQACPRYIAVLNGHGKEFFISRLLHICKMWNLGLLYLLRYAPNEICYSWV